MQNIKKTAYATLVLAAILWLLLFVIKPLNFWLEMAISIGILSITALVLNRGNFDFRKFKFRDVVTGIGSAIFLYLVFYVGNIISGFLFPFKDAQILSVYSNGKGVSPVIIGLLLLLLIGPGEEIFWRGFIQKVFCQRYGDLKGWIIAVLLYTGVHIFTGNFMLVIAAFVCGTFWGFLYMKEKSLLPIIISHAIWDVMAFVLFPFQ